MTYKRMTEADRRQIHRWRQEGDGQRELAWGVRRAASASASAGSSPVTQAAGLPSKAGARAGAKAGSAAGAASVHG